MQRYFVQDLSVHHCEDPQGGQGLWVWVSFLALQVEVESTLQNLLIHPISKGVARWACVPSDLGSKVSIKTGHERANASQRAPTKEVQMNRAHIAWEIALALGSQG